MLKHRTQSTLPDGAKANQVQTQRDWNDDHVFQGGATGSLLYRDTSQDSATPNSGLAGFTWLAAVATGSFLRSAGVGAAPVWSTTTLPNTVTAGDLLVATGANVVGSIADVATGSVLVSGGIGAVPTWSATPTITTSVTVPTVFGGSAVGSTLTIRSTSTNGTTDAIIFQTGAASERMRINNGGVVSFGGTGAGVVAIRPNGNHLEVVTADESSFAQIGATIYRLYSGTSNVGLFYSASGDGVFLMQNAAGTDFARLQFGGTSSAFPALRRNGAVLDVTVGDNSVYGTLAVNTINLKTTGGTATGSIAASTTTGVFTFLDGAGTSFARLQFGGTTSSFPALRRTGTTLEVRLADDSTFAGMNMDSLGVQGSGGITLSSSGAGVTVAAGGFYHWNGQSYITSPADSQILLRNNAVNNFDMLMFGGTTSSFPALKRNAAILEVKLADNSAYGQINALLFNVTSGGSTTISTGVGSIKMSTANPATNAAWIPLAHAGTTYFVPGFTTNAP